MAEEQLMEEGEEEEEEAEGEEEAEEEEGGALLLRLFPRELPPMAAVAKAARVPWRRRWGSSPRTRGTRRCPRHGAPTCRASSSRCVPGATTACGGSWRAN